MPIAIVVDAILILIFAAVGKSSHDVTGGVGEVLIIAWPFLVGAGIGWIAAISRKRPPYSLNTGLIVWLGTLVLGMIVRGTIGGRGVVVSFVIVAGIVLAIFLLGWRLIYGLATRRTRAAVRPQDRSQ